jgi:hypothetical protein
MPGASYVQGPGPLLHYQFEADPSHVLTDNSDVVIARGPTNRRGKQYGAPDLDNEESTVSHSSTSSSSQVSVLRR